MLVIFLVILIVLVLVIVKHIRLFVTPFLTNKKGRQKYRHYMYNNDIHNSKIISYKPNNLAKMKIQLTIKIYLVEKRIF